MMETFIVLPGNSGGGSTSCGTLNGLLSDLFVLYVKSLSYHWHVKGPTFVSLHDLFKSIYEGLSELLDDLAERILAIDGKPLSTMADFMATAALKEGNSSFKAEEMLQDLFSDLSFLNDKCSKVFKVCSDTDDDGSADLVLEIQSFIAKKRWMIKSLLEF